MKKLPTIGTQFIPNRKTKKVHTVVDIHTVTNFKGKVIRHEIITEHEFMGQKIKNITPLSTIALSKKYVD
jgi:hypothetical protein